MKPQKALLALTLAAGMLLGGCTPGVSDDILCPPKTTGREAEIQRLIETAAGGSYTMKYPKTGQYRSAIITKDLDGDGSDEAVSFYRSGDDSSSTKMLVMSNTGGQWKLCGDFSISCGDVDCVRFADCNYDGVEEIFAGFVKSQLTNELMIFELDPKKESVSKMDCSIPYSGFAIGDYDRDGSNEILSLTTASSENEACAVLTDYNNNKLYTLDECSIDSDVIKLERVSSGLIYGESTGVTVDGTLESGYCTQVIFYDNSERELLCFPRDAGKHRNEPITRDYGVFCEDINGDGYVEIPTVEYSSSKSGSGTIAPEISWCRLNPDKLKLEESTVCISDFDFSFSLKLPDNLVGNICAVLSDDKRTLGVYTDSGGEPDILMFNIRVFDIGTPTDKMSGYSALESYNQYIYTYKIENDSIYYIDDDIIKNSFLINDLNQKE